jgi:benzylsuccinate CoA-transferase BbsF subunit
MVNGYAGKILNVDLSCSTISYDESSFRLAKAPAELKSPAPCLGEHTAYVCAEILGMSDEEFVQLSEEGVFE